MQRDLVRDGIRFKLAERYRENPAGFLSLSKEAIDSALGREIVAELRNEGYVEEEVRGTIRLTPRGYRAFQNDPPPYSYRNGASPVQ
jgi:predicted transcriptional regulator